MVQVPSLAVPVGSSRAAEVAGRRGATRRMMLVALLGTTLSWYDFFLYLSASVVVFNHLFFPFGTWSSGILLAVGLYGASFVARPVGGLLFGHVGDRFGRRPALVLTLVLTGVCTGLIGVLPPYWEIGVAAPVLLVVLRLVQGVGVGGAWSAAVGICAESAPAERRGFVTSWAQVGAPVGNLLAVGTFGVMSAVMSTGEFLSWGWRVPFLFSAVLVVAGLWARFRIAESPEFTEARSAGAASRTPVRDVLGRHRRGVLTAVGIALGADVIVVGFSFGFVLTRLLGAGMTQGTVLLVALVAPTILIGLIPAFGALSDRYGRERVCLGGVCATAIWVMLFFPLLAWGSLPLLVAAYVLSLAGFAAMYAPQAALLAELFPTSVRSSGMAIGYQVAALLGGTSAPLLITRLPGWFHTEVAIVGYLLLALAITAGAVLSCAQKGRQP